MPYLKYILSEIMPSYAAYEAVYDADAEFAVLASV